MLVMVNIDFPVLVSVAVWGRLDWPRSTVPNSREAGTSFTLPTVIVIWLPTAVARSAAEVAISDTAGSGGTEAGALWESGVPLGELVAESVPQPAEQTIPFWLRFQVTPLFAGSF